MKEINNSLEAFANKLAHEEIHKQVKVMLKRIEQLNGSERNIKR